MIRRFFLQFRRLLERRGVASFMDEWLLACVAIAGFSFLSVRAGESVRFEEIAREAGFLHRHAKPVLDSKLGNINAWVSSVGAAAAAGDFNRDGYIDLYVTNSRKGRPNYLYRNNGDGTFTDVAPQAGLASVNDEEGTSMDCVWGDFDNDGWTDLYLVRWGRDRLFRNNGDGSFTEETAKRFRRRDGGAGTDWANGNAAVFLDYNLDGRLDIYVGNYFKETDLWHLENTSIMHDDFEVSRNGGANYLYRQEADGTFVEVAKDLGVDDTGWTLSVGSGDLNNDGWPDLYCADDFGPDQLYLNRLGRFENVSDGAIGPDTKKGMNVDMGDFNGDGWLDVYVANITTAEYLQEGNMLWHNNGPDASGRITFTDVALESGTYDGGWGWGAKFFDYDHDADLDIIAVNGFISAGRESYWYDLASWTVLDEDVADAANWPAIGDKSFSGYETTRVWRNDGYYTFQERSAALGLKHDGDGRGVVCFDFDNDGDLDLFVANQDQEPAFFRNSLQRNSNRHWIMIQLIGDPGTGVSSDAIGARATVVTTRGRQIRERDGGNSFSGQSDPRLHFGLGEADQIQLIEIRWPDGGLQYLENVAADRHLVVRQDVREYSRRVELAAVARSAPISKKQERTPSAKRTRLKPDELEAELNRLESQMKESLSGYASASQYRLLCRDQDRHDRAIQFFQRLVEKDASNLRARVELGCAYVDKIETCGGLAAIVCKGTLAKKSLDQLDYVVEKSPRSWVGFYTRGMNHLHWPTALRHSDNAARDFERCLELQKRMDFKPYFALSHLALGDAYAKAKEFEKARAAWKAGARRFPEDRAFYQRLRHVEDDALFEYVERQRSLEASIDTDLSMLDE